MKIRFLILPLRFITSRWFSVRCNPPRLRQTDKRIMHKKISRFTDPRWLGCAAFNYIFAIRRALSNYYVSTISFATQLRTGLHCGSFGACPTIFLSSSLFHHFSDTLLSNVFGTRTRIFAIHFALNMIVWALSHDDWIFRWKITWSYSA